MGSPAAMAGTRTSAPGSRARAAGGFTLIELLVVVALVAIASAVVSLALRDPTADRLEQEAVRLAAMLEAARAEARASGLPVRWVPLDDAAQGGPGFRFVGLPAPAAQPRPWLHEGVSAQVVGAAAVQLGPEPLIAPQRIVLRLDERQLVLASDGLGPFVVVPQG